MAMHIKCFLECGEVVSTKNTLIPQWSILNKGTPILETFRRESGRLIAFAWTDELSSRDAGKLCHA